MQELDDNALLREYAQNQSDEAFAALVARHINKVYSAALRHTHNPGEAEEITQAVFVILARKAPQLGKKVIVSGWLYQTARLASLTYLRSEIRRSRREQEAHAMQTILNAPEHAWAEIAPLLDTAMAGLNETDRHAVVLRFFDGKSVREVGEALGTTELAARKRLSRALEKLQRFFARRGVSSTTAIIAGAISSNSVQPAPAALAQSVTAVAIAQGATAGTSTLTLVKGVLKAMSMQKLKIMAVAGAVAILATAGTTALGVEQATKPMAKFHYRFADDFYQAGKSVDTNILNVCLAVVTVNNVPPANVNWTIHSTSKGAIVFRPSPNGLITLDNFPDDPVLRRENPDITGNQPVGTYFLVPLLLVPIPEEQKFHYNDLVPNIDEGRRFFASFNKVITPGNVGWAKYLGWLLFHPMPKVDGVVFFFPNSGGKRATLKIQTSSHTGTYHADANGMIFLSLKNNLLSNNPEIVLSEKPVEMQLGYDFGGTFYANYK